MTTRTRALIVIGGLALATLIVWAASTTRLEAPWVSAAAAVFSAGAAVATAGIGARTLRQVREDSLESSRPMVVVDLEHADAQTLPGADNAPEEADQYQDIVVRNVGKSVARNLQVTFDPEIPHTAGASPAVDLLLEKFGKSLTLSPGTEARTLYHGPIGLPTQPQVDVLVTYDDGRDHVWTDRFPLDVRALETRTRVLVGRLRGSPAPVPADGFGAAPERPDGPQ